MGRLTLSRVAVCLFGINVTLVVFHLLFVWLDPSSVPFRALLDLDAEGTIPAWYTAAQLLVTGLVFVLAGERVPRSAAVAPWFLWLVGLGFVFLSLDEAAGVHETVTVVLRRFEFLPRFRGDHGIWIPLYLVSGVALMAGTAKSWMRLFQAQQRGVLILAVGAFLFVLGAVGLEIFSYVALRETLAYHPYMVGVAFEEGLEMFGVSTMLIGGIIVTSGLAGERPTRDLEPAASPRA